MNELFTHGTVTPRSQWQWQSLLLYSIYISVDKATHSQVMLLGEELYNDRHLQSYRLIFESVSVTILSIPPIYLLWTKISFQLKILQFHIETG